MAMDHTVCPGSKKMRSPTPESLKCRCCGYEVEIWSDELRVECPHCKSPVMRKGLSSCLDWCKMGKQCVGEAVFNSYMENRSVSIRQQLFKELEAVSGGEKRLIDRAAAVVAIAEELNKTENGEWNIVVPAAILQAIGPTAVTPAEASQTVRKILLKIGMRMEDIEIIGNVLAHFRAPACGEAASQNCKIIHDAVLLAEADEKSAEKVPPDPDAIRPSTSDFLTPTGVAMAKKLSL
jgi:DNA-directed RNA polymerase subunit RPC12/RpoP